MHKAEEGIAELKKNVDALIVIPNERLLNLAEKRTTLLAVLQARRRGAGQAVKGISDVVMVHGYMNVDFADVKTVMANRGRAVMGTGVGKGEGRAIDAAQKAIASPLLEDGSIKGARAVLINVTGGERHGHLRIQRGLRDHQGGGGPVGEHHRRRGDRSRHERGDHGHGDRDGLRRAGHQGARQATR